MSDNDFDDGLVHGHTWAKEPMRPSPGPTTVAVTADAGRTGDAREYDDGLVHGHDWART